MKRKIIVSILTAMVLIGLVVYSCQNITWISIHDSTVGPAPEWALFNVFRDRKPENIANNFMQSLDSGITFDQLKLFITDNEYIGRIMTREKEYKIINYKLVYISKKKGMYEYT